MARIEFPPQSNRWGNREWALTYAARGWRVFPVYEAIPDGDGGWLCSCNKGTECDRPAKHPRTVLGLNEASNDRDQVERWWTQWPNASIGIATGRASGITVVDADASNGKPGVVNLTQLCAAHGGVPNTMVVLTGGGGLHLYFVYTDRVSTGTDVLAEAIDVRNDGGYVIAPPARHVSGALYRWRSEHGGEQIELPQWLAESRGNVGAGRGGRGGDNGARRAGRPRAQPGFRLDRIESMLAVIDPDDRDRWLNVGIVLGRLYVGSGLENDAWAVYEAWASRSDKFDDDRAGNLARMREAFSERSQQPPPRGGEQVGVGSIIAWARAAGWTPFGNRAVVSWEPGNEAVMCEELAQALVAHEHNRFFNVMGAVREALRAPIPIARMIQEAASRGEPSPECLLVRTATPNALWSALSEVAVLETIDRHGVPTAKPIGAGLCSQIMDAHAAQFPVLAGVSEWPLVAADGSILMKDRGYDAETGLYFEVDRALKLDETVKAADAWSWLRQELLADYPFETEVDEAKALALLVAMMQRPLMKTCPAFGVTAPQAGTGKSTLIEMAAMAIHGSPIANHAFSGEPEELRKAIHSLLLAKISAVMFDNMRKGMAIDNDEIAKLLTSELATDRTLGSSETRKEVNTLLVTFTGNSIVFARDMASRALMVRLNAKAPNPLGRKFRHPDVRRWAREQRPRVLSALVSLVRAGVGAAMPDGQPTRFEDFDLHVARAVYVATGIDLRSELNCVEEVENEQDDDHRAALELLWRWQQRWRSESNGQAWRVTELIAAIDAKTFDEGSMKVLQRAIGDARGWEQDVRGTIGRALRSMNGDHRFAPLVLSSKLDAKSKTNKWSIVGGPDLSVKQGGDGKF
jgi:hypothetical protein